MKARVKVLAVFLLGLHLLFIGFSSFKKAPAALLPLGRGAIWLDLYGYLTGAGSHYGFFAPGVLSQFRVDFELVAGGKSLGTQALTTGNPETTFRLYNIVQNFWLTRKPSDEGPRRALAASLAGKLLAEHPEADAVRLTVKARVLPSTREYRDGARPTWETHYQAEFHRGATGPTTAANP